jgi:hypothetical protein
VQSSQIWLLWAFDLSDPRESADLLLFTIESAAEGATRSETLRQMDCGSGSTLESGT